MFNYKLYFKYLFFKSPFVFIDNLAQRSKNTNICIGNSLLLYSCSHLKMSSMFYASQLCDMFAYELVAGSNSSAQGGNSGDTFAQKYLSVTRANAVVVVYNFHSMYSQNRFFLFVQNSYSALRSRKLSINNSLESITELFPAANWLEREIAELFGLCFMGKKDLRNLMLQYGDSTAPFQKLFPTVGLKEMVYDIVKDTLVQVRVSLQV